MRTVFFTVFQAVEVKNLLRTSVVDKLLKEPDVRVVLFMKNQVRIDHYKKEFSHPRLVYEAVNIPRSRGLDAFFSGLKFTLLRTDTTRLRRKLFFEDDKNAFRYYAGSFLNWSLARSSVRRVARALDYGFVSSNAYAPYFEKYKPDAVFCAHLFDEAEVGLLREAKKRSIKTIGFINSWDKVTARCILRLLPDKMIVFNDVIKDEIIRHNEMPGEDILTSGIPQYDYYFEGACSPREEFFKKIGIDPRKKLIVFVPAGQFSSNSDWLAIDLLYKLEREEKFGKNTAILVRFPPNHFLDEKEAEKRKSFLKYDHPGVRFMSKMRGDWDMTQEDLTHLKDTLYHMSLLISYGASSVNIDSAVFNKPIIQLNFELMKSAVPSKSIPRYYNMEHIKKAFASGGARKVGDADELAEWVNKYLKNPSLDEKGRKNIVAEQYKYLDGKAAERIADYILNEIK